jgi:NADPH-dependent ferric siderophore reductase
LLLLEIQRCRLGRWGRTSRAGNPLVLSSAQRQIGAATRRPASIAGFIRHDLQQPGSKWRISMEAGERSVGLDKCLLGDVLRLGSVAGDQVRDAEGDGLVARDKLFERPSVTLPRLLDEPGIYECGWCGLQWTALHGVVPWLLHRPPSCGSFTIFAAMSVEVVPLPQSLLTIPGVQPLELTVNDVAELGPHMRRIALSGVPASFTYQPGQDVMLVLGQAGDRPLSRRYTIRAVNNGVLELNIVAHGVDGPGARWAAAVQPGDRINAVGPRGKIFLNPDAEWHLFLGDECAAPASLAMLEALPQTARGLAYLEADAELPHRAVHAVHWLQPDQLGKAVAAFDPLPGRGHIYINGEVQQAATLKQQAIARGFDPEWISAKAYWGRGKPNALRGEPDEKV